MHFSVSSFSLLQKLNFLSKIINNKNYSGYFTFKILEKTLIIFISDFDNNILTTKIKICVKKSSKAKIDISAKLIIQILQIFPKKTIIFIKKKQNILNINYEKINYPIPIFKKKYNNYIKKKCIKNNIKIIISYNTLLKILNKTLFYISTDYFNNIPNGVNFKFTPLGATFVATNTYILIKYTINYLKLNHSTNFTISKKSLQIIKNILINHNNNYIKKKKIIIEYNQINLVKFKFKNKTFLCKIINQKYPNYNSIIPNNNTNNIILKINRLLFLNSIKRISFFTKKFIFFSLKNDKLKIYKKDTLIYNYLKIELIINNFKYKSIQMGFNYKFLIKILSSLDENFINFEFYHLNKIGLLKPYHNNKKENILILIMSIII